MTKHLLILGGGSAALTGAMRAADAGWRVTMANAGLPLGGTCLNVGCVPSKFFIRAAESMQRARRPAHPGLRAGEPEIDFDVFVAAKQRLVDELRRVNYEERIPTIDGLRLIEGRAGLTADQDGVAMTVNGERIEGDAALVATGERTFVPPVPGLAGTPFLTNETVFDLPARPASMLVLGGGYIALECAQMFQRMGTRVTLLQRSARVLRHQPEDLAHTLQDALRDEGLRLVCDCAIHSVGHTAADGFLARTSQGDFAAERLFVGTGRVANVDGLPPEIVADNRVPVDEFGRTALPRVYAAGDVTGEAQFVYTASHEADTAVAHLLGEAPEPIDYAALPWVVFTDPQVAGVGLSLAEARAEGIDADAAELPVARWPRFRVSCEDRGFLRLVRDRATNVLVGARAVCPEAGDLMPEIALLIRLRVPVPDIAKVLHPYLTLPEGIERAAARFE